MESFRRSLLGACALAALAAAADAKVDLVTLPARDRVQLTIYNAADLTLARDRRSLTVSQGANRLQFSWSNTLIDPTSLELTPLAEAASIQVQSLEFPPRVQGLGIWHLTAQTAGAVPFELNYFTSGISWHAYYLATLTPDERAVRLEGYVRVTNHSGEDYEDAETRLVVGQVNLLDAVAALARRPEPYGRPGPAPRPAAAPREDHPRFLAAKAALMEAAPKEILKEGLSEYFLYTIAGTEDIPDGWGKRLLSFTADPVPVRTLFRYEAERYGDRPVRFLAFVNDRAHGLGQEPIPGGPVKAFRQTPDGALAYVGTQELPYVPPGGEVNLNLGPSDLVAVEFTPMDLATDNYQWHEDRITGWDEHHTVRVKVANHRDAPTQLELRRSFPTPAWQLTHLGDPGAFAKIDVDTVQYTLDLPPHGRHAFTYRLTLHHGTRGGR